MPTWMGTVCQIESGFLYPAEQHGSAKHHDECNVSKGGVQATSKPSTHNYQIFQ